MISWVRVSFPPQNPLHLSRNMYMLRRRIVPPPGSRPGGGTDRKRRPTPSTAGAAFLFLGAGGEPEGNNGGGMYGFRFGQPPASSHNFLQPLRNAQLAGRR